MATSASNPTSIIAMAESFFILGYVATILVSRPDPNDKSLFGGQLSRPFRQTLCVIASLNVVRTLFLEDRRFLNCNDDRQENAACHDVGMTWLFYAMIGSESFGLTFLTFLTPYLLQHKLKDYQHNIRPGDNLLIWVYLVFVMTFTGVVLSAQVSPNLWAIKRLGESLCSIPTIKTINLYRRITNHPANAAGNHHGQTFIGTVLGVEYWSMGIVFVAAVGYFMDSHDDHRGDDLWRAFRICAIFLSQLKAFVHGILLTMIDEAQFLLKRPTLPNEQRPGEKTVPLLTN